MPKGKYRGVSLSKETIELIEKIIKENPQAGYSSIADFVSDSLRIRFQQLGVYPESLTILEINANERGPLLFDRTLGKSVQIVISPKGIECQECGNDNCRHVKFALAKPETFALIKQKRKEGWKLPDV